MREGRRLFFPIKTRCLSQNGGNLKALLAVKVMGALFGEEQAREAAVAFGGTKYGLSDAEKVSQVRCACPLYTHKSYPLGTQGTG